MHQIDNTQDITSIRDLRPLVKDQLADDLSKLLLTFKNQTIGLRIIGKKTQISEKTLERILLKKSDPHENTIVRFYSYFFKQNINSTDKSSLHEMIKKFIEIDTSYTNNKINLELEEHLKTNKVFRDLFLLTRVKEISLKTIISEYGKYGIQMIELMAQNDIVKEIDHGVFSCGNVTINKSPETLKNIISDLITSHLDCENLSEKNKNQTFYMLNNVSEDTYIKILQKTENYKKEISELIFNSTNTGPIAVFTLAAVDTIKSKDTTDNVLH